MSDIPDMEFAKDLFETYRQMMYNTAFGILRNKADAEDIVQNAFLWVINNLDKIMQIPYNERVFYFATIIEHTSINFINKQKRHPIEDIDEHRDIASNCSIEDKVDENIMIEEIECALEELSDRDYSIMYLYAFKQMKPKEIAKALDISEKNIRVYIKIARERLIKILRQRGFYYDI